MSNRLPLLSIIIPVYNLQDYIVHALDSVYSQQADSSLFEVIVVDDGSKDESLRVITDYAASHENMVVHSQENGGVSKARNVAMDIAKGEYITFLDGDDRFAEGSLDRLFDAIRRPQQADVIYCRTFRLYPTGEVETHLWQRHFTPVQVYDGNDMINARYLNGGSVCGGLYRTEYIRSQQLSFAEGVANAEDTIFNYILYSRNPKIRFEDIRLNLIIVREGSASRSPSIERVARFQNNIIYLMEYRDSHDMTRQEREIVDMAVYNSITQATNMYIKNGGEDVGFMINVLRLKNILPLRIRRMPLKDLLRLCCLNYCYPLFFRLFRKPKK